LVLRASNFLSFFSFFFFWLLVFIIIVAWIYSYIFLTSDILPNSSYRSCFFWTIYSVHLVYSCTYLLPPSWKLFFSCIRILFSFVLVPPAFDCVIYKHLYFLFTVMKNGRLRSSCCLGYMSSECLVSAFKMLPCLFVFSQKQEGIN
jgi:hypothetical protein